MLEVYSLINANGQPQELQEQQELVLNKLVKMPRLHTLH